MKLPALAAVSILGLILSGCVSDVPVTRQDITIVTTPADASCVFEREGQQIGTIASTPGTVNVTQTLDDITIKCDKAGFQQAHYLNHMDTSISAKDVAMGILTEPLGELTLGAYSPPSSAKYDSPVKITLIPLGTSSTIPTTSPTTPAAAALAPLPSNPSPNVTQVASLPPQSQLPSANPFAGQWLVSGKGAFGTSIGSYLWKIDVTGNTVSLTGEFGEATFKEGHVDGDRVTLLWTGIVDYTFEGKLVSPTRIEGQAHHFLGSADWWAEKQ
jgi:hypothetical protein